MDIVCAYLPSLTVALAQRGQSPSSCDGLLIVDKLERGRVVACDPVAANLGVQVGMTVLQASSRLHNPTVLVADPKREQQIWQELLDALDLASPLVEDVRPGVALIYMRGIAGSPQDWITHIRHILQSSDLPFTFACASKKSVAQMMAACNDGACIAAGGEAKALAPLPLHAADVSEKLYRQIRTLGIQTLGELAAVPYAPFVRRFGQEAALLHERARGIDRSLPLPRPHTMRIERTLFGEGYASSQEQVLFALRTLIIEIVDDLANAGLRCGRLRCFLECEDAETHEFVIQLAQATTQKQVFFDLFKARLERIVLHAPVIGARIAAEALEEGGHALALFRDNEPDLDQLAHTVMRLHAFLHDDAVRQVRFQPAHRNDEAFVDLPVRTVGHASHYPVSALPDQTRLSYRIVPTRHVHVECRQGKPTRVERRRVLHHAGPWRYEQRWWAEHIPGDAPYRHDDQFEVLLETGALWRIAQSRERWVLCGVYD